jgi:uracil-DNA glycosylase
VNKLPAKPVEHSHPPGPFPKRPTRTVKTLNSLLAEIRACRVCGESLPLGPRPVVQASTSARILIASQAPGAKAHGSGIPFSDASGAHLREWLDMSTDEFYDESRVAILPMAFCYPGRLGSGGDAPPRLECSPLWRQQLLARMPNLRLTLLVGTYAQDYALGRGKMTERVKDFRKYLPSIFPLPHPSWRSRRWATLNPWFESELLPELRSAVRATFE